MIEDMSQYDLLAEILTSKKVGLSHVRLVGEVIVARSRLNQWVLEKGKGSLSAAAWSDMTERALECEARCAAAWGQVEKAESPPSSNERLRRLEAALRDAASTFIAIREQLDRETS